MGINLEKIKTLTKERNNEHDWENIKKTKRQHLQISHKNSTKDLIEIYAFKKQATTKNFNRRLITKSKLEKLSTYLQK